MKKFILPFLALICCVSVRAHVSEIPDWGKEYQELVRRIDARAAGIELPEEAVTDSTGIADEAEDAVQTEPAAADTIAAEQAAEDSELADRLPFEHPLPKFAPVRMRARAPKADACPVDSIQGFDPDNNLSTLITYIYDAQGRTVETASWQWVDGKKQGVSKSETVFYDNGSQKMTATWEWDVASDNWRGTKKEEYEYDASGRTTLWLVSEWGDNDWIGQQRTTYAYNAAGLTLESAVYVYDKEKGGWVGVTKIENTYDDANRSLIALSSVWSTETNNWVPADKYEKEYNAAGKSTLDAHYSAYDAATATWTGDYKRTYTYDSANRDLVSLTYAWNAETNDWMPKDKVEKEYNAAGKITLDMHYSAYDAATAAWTGDYKKTYTYDDANRQLIFITYAWNATAADWVYSKQHEDQYDAAGNKTLDLDYTSYDAANEMWIGNYKNLATYNSAKKKLLDEQYTWDKSKKDWKGKSKKEYEYNAAGKTTMTLVYTWVAADWNWTYNTKTDQAYDEKNRETDKAVYSWKDGAWQGSSRTATTYTSAGKKETFITFAWKDGDWVKSTLAGYVYSGSLTTEEYTQTWDGEAWVNVTTKKTTYTASNKPETIFTYNWADDAWQNNTRELYTYNAKGVNIQVHKSKWTDGKWTLTGMSRTDIKLDGAGREILTASYTCGADSVWVGDKKDEWTYNEKGTLVYRAEFEFGESDWVYVYKVTWKYDEAGRKLEELRYNYSNGNEMPYYWYVYAYDEKGNEILSMMLTGSGMAWVGSYRTERTWLDNGQVGQLVSYAWRNNDWEGMFRTSYVYDSKGRDIEHVVEKFEDGAWNNYTRSLHEYNAHELTVKAIDYEWLDGDWAYTSRSEIEYDSKDDKVRKELKVTYSSPGVVKEYSDLLYFYACDPKYYTVVFADWDGKELQSDKLLEGTKPEYKGDAPERKADAQYTYKFAGWDKELAAVAGNITYTATYSTTLNKYTVTFYDEDGEKELQKGELEYGKMPVYEGEDPVKTGDAQYTYTFAGWDKEIVAVTGEASYKATYTQTVNKYTVIFYDEDGVKVLQSSEFEYGAVPVYEGETPTKASDAENRYTFAGWDNELVAVTGEASYKATYTPAANKYLVTFYDEDGITILDSKEVEYGTVPVYEGEAPVKTADAQYTYTFAGWDNEIVAVTGEASYKATYSTTTNKYTVTFYDEVGEKVLDTKEVEYGVTPVYEGEAPAKAADAQYTYTFAGWDNELVAVTGTASYKATYSITTNKYTVTFYDEGGKKILWTEVLEYGVTPEYKGEKPMKEGNQQYSYSFMGWDNDIVPVTGDAVYTAVFMQNINKFTVTFRDADGVTELQSKNYEYGEVPVYEGETPTKIGDAQYSYVFNGWDKEIVAVTEYTVYTAQYKEEVNKYLITFYDEDGTTVLWSSAFAYGTTPVYGGETPATTGDAQYSHMFKGWDKALAEVTGEASYKAQYEDVLNEYTVTVTSSDDAMGSVLGDGTYSYGTNVTLEAVAEDGYMFLGWSNGSTANPYQFELTGDVTLVARFQEEIKAEEVEDVAVEAQAEASTTSVTVTWPVVADAVLYKIEIITGGNAVVTLTFNGLGQLLSSAAPARDRLDSQPAMAAQVVKGWQYTVNGLDADKEYTYTVTATKSDNTVAYTRSIVFRTNGTATDLPETGNAAASQTVKVVENGVLYIIRDGVKYDASGNKVR